MKSFKKIVMAFGMASSLAIVSSSVSAGGIGGMFVASLCGGCGVGEFLDDVHHGVKQANPQYGKWEEESTNNVREDIGLQPHCQPVYNKWGEEVGCY